MTQEDTQNKDTARRRLIRYSGMNQTLTTVDRKQREKVKTNKKEVAQRVVGQVIKSAQDHSIRTAAIIRPHDTLKHLL